MVLEFPALALDPIPAAVVPALVALVVVSVLVSLSVVVVVAVARSQRQPKWQLPLDHWLLVRAHDPKPVSECSRGTFPLLVAEQELLQQLDLELELAVDALYLTV
jgi:hypothetical protein